MSLPELPTDFTIDELSIPSLADGSDADFDEMIDVRNAIETGILGSDALSHSAAELLPSYQPQQYETKRMFLARVAGRIVGRAILWWSNAPDSDVAKLVGEVTPEFRGRGIGAAFFDRLERLAREAGRGVAQTSAVHSNAVGGRRLVSPTGFGRLSTADPGVRFMERRGYLLEQVDRISFLDLPVAPGELGARFRETERRAGPDYGVVGWTGRTPRKWLADLAVLKTQMNADEPTGGLDVDPESWDAERVQWRDEEQAATGRELLTVAVVHHPTGRLVGFSELAIPLDRARPAGQEDTLVQRAHRGHRLGMLLKLANLRQLEIRNPQSPLIYTFNAEENRPMLDVNEAVGFRAVGYQGAWKRSLRH